MSQDLFGTLWDDYLQLTAILKVNSWKGEEFDPYLPLTLRPLAETTKDQIGDGKFVFSTQKNGMFTMNFETFTQLGTQM